MNLVKKYWVEINGDRFDLDDTRIAHWERFLPYLENDDFFINYLHINKITEGKDSLSKRIRFFSLYQTLKNIINKYPNENIVECGCFNGCSTYIIAKLLEKNNFKEKFYIFDSFEGLSNFAKEDLTINKKHQPIKNYFKTNEKKFNDLFKQFPFISIKKGWIPSRFDEIKDKTFSYINIDVDIYQPTRDSLEFFYLRLINGGCIHLDDYNLREWPGNKKALDLFLNNNEVSFFYQLPLGGAFIIK
jgi:hypothetical protein